MNKVTPSKEQISNLYAKGYSMKEIGDMLGVATGKIHKLFHLYNIIPRKPINEFTRAKMSKAQRGKKYALGCKRSKETREKMSIAKSNGIGRKEIHNGYVRIYFPSHPKADKRGLILEHDLIMECAIGRWLRDDEVVHHKNKITTDNRLENLELMTRSEHTRLHRLERRDDLSIR